MHFHDHFRTSRRFMPSSLMHWLTLLLVLLCGCAASPSASPTAPRSGEVAPPTPTLDNLVESANGAVTELATNESLALFTFVHGSVLLESAGARAPAVLFAPIPEGSRVVAEADAQATLVCSNNRVITTEGPSTVEVTEANCNSGSALPGNTATLVTPIHGQMRVNDGSFDLEEDAREQESDYGNIPIILRPRNSNLLDLEPVILWVEVGGAIEYVLSLSGPSAYAAVEVKAEMLACRQAPPPARTRVCTLPWPKEQWTLQAGKRYFLTVSARLKVAESLRESEKSSLRTLRADDAALLQTQRAALEMLRLDEVTTDLLLAGLYAEAGVYDEAIARYEQVVALYPLPVIYNTLGDSYRVIDLQRYAFQAYQQALEILAQGADDPGAEASAEFGMGQIERSRMNFTAAEQHFAKAVELYAQIGAQEELRAAQSALDETRQHL